jgi:4-cresol dehydrogenase (hydroxylating)
MNSDATDHDGKERLMLKKIASRLAGHAGNTIPGASFEFDLQAWPTRLPTFSPVINELRAAVGKDFVLTDGETIRHWSRSCFPEGTTPRVVVRPACTAEVQQIVQIAAQHELSVHPVSCGKNWGYGDACAATDGQIILDLKRMNRILEVNEELAYATVEPGVSQGQLAEYLETFHPALWMDATGAGPDASIVGNTLERGFGHTPHGDRFQHACGMEVVLPDGRLLKTGFGHFQNAQATAVYKWGVGPYLDGLFSQSNLGIVTKLTFWLMPKPECFKALLFTAKNEQDLGALVEALRPLRLNGTLRTPIHLFNDWRLLAGCTEFPWETADGKTALSEEVLTQLKRTHGVDAWTGSGGIYGTKAEVAAALKAVKKALRNVRGLKRLAVLDERLLRVAELGGKALGFCGLGRGLRELLRKARICFDLLRGKSSKECLKGAHWRVRRAGGRSRSASADPLDHHAGFFWVSPVVPMTRAHVERFTGLVKPIFAKHGFEYQVTFSLVTARALCAVTTISYDKSNAEETGRAEACHDALWGALLAAGYVPYRAGNSAMKRLAETSEVFWDVAGKIKAALDPHDVVSPGHYQPERAVALKRLGENA